MNDLSKECVYIFGLSFFLYNNKNINHIFHRVRFYFIIAPLQSHLIHAEIHHNRDLGLLKIRLVVCNIKSMLKSNIIINNIQNILSTHPAYKSINRFASRQPDSTAPCTVEK